MELSPTVREIKPRSSKQSFNILLHQALDEETQQQRGEGEEKRRLVVAASPLSCPNNPIDKEQLWEETFSAIVSKKVPKPIPESDGPVRVKYNRHKKGLPDSGGDGVTKADSAKGAIGCELPSYDSVEMQKQLMKKLHRGNSLSDTETDDLEELRSHRRQKRTQTLKTQRVKILGAFDLSAKFGAKK